MKPEPFQSDADPVCEFYTSHPFPAPVKNMTRDVWRDENVHRAEFHLLWPDKEYRADLDVLVAGCGTQEAARFALNHPAAHVVGIDVAPPSIQCHEMLKREHNLTNLEVRQLPIENVADLDQRFDLIISIGVLHHLADPDVGLRALRSVLKSDGAMYLLVYAPYGRAGVYVLEEYCRSLGIGTSKQELTDLTAVLKALPEHHPLFAAQGGAREYLDAGPMADALMNPRHRAYSVPQLFEFIERNGLVLGGWDMQAQYLPQCGSFAATPHAKKLAARPEREQYAAMELWRGSMTVHSFVVHRNDMHNHGSKIRFDDEQYLRYVPIRRPATMCVRQGVPPGAEGVLLNKLHPFPDLFLVINKEEKRMLDAINGRRSISEIAGKEGNGASLARRFFEKLWWYDQVVFNASKALLVLLFHCLSDEISLSNLLMALS